MAEKRGEGEKKTSQFSGREKEGKRRPTDERKEPQPYYYPYYYCFFFCCCCLFISSTLSLLLIPLLSLLEWISLIYACFFFFSTHMNVRRFLLFYNHRFLSVYHSLLFFFFLSDFICSYLLLFVCLFACFPLLFFFSVCYLSTVATHSWSFFFSLFSFFPA